MRITKEHAMIDKQILSTSPIINVWRTVERINMLKLGIKELDKNQESWQVRTFTLQEEDSY